MKKTLLLLMVMYMAKMLGQTCTPAAAPFLQSFSTGVLPSCWTNQNSSSTSATALWKFTGAPGYGASATMNGSTSGTFAWVDASSPYSGIHNVELISPQINLTGLTVPYVEFDWFKNHSSSSTSTVLPTRDNNKLKVEVNNGSGWVQIFSDDSNSTQWRNVGIALPTTYSGTTIQLKFTVDKDVAGNGYIYDDLLLDNVEVKEAPACIAPSALTLGTVTGATAFVSWTAPATAPTNGYDVYYSTSSTAPNSLTSPILPGVSGTSTTLSPLTTNTTYYVWVRSRCSTSDYSDWIALPSFTTLCGAYTVPFLESFGSGALPGCWTNQNSSSTSATALWKFTGAPGYGASATMNGSTSGTFAWVDASSPYSGIHNVELISPQIDLTGLTTPYIQFDWFKNHSSSSTSTVLPTRDNNQLKVEVNNGSGWIQIFSNDSNSTQWRNVGIALPTTYSGTIIQLKFTVDKDVAGNGYLYDDLLLDNIAVKEAPACLDPLPNAPTNITATSATLSWTAPTLAPANGYEYYISTTNVAPSGTGTPIATTSVDVTLLAGTNYYWWVRSICSATDHGNWVSGPDFITTQIPAVLPYTQNFEATNDLGLLNGTQTNKWAYGSATGNTGKSIYISNDNGVTNAYTITSTSIVQAYRDIKIPAGTTLADFSFDWKAEGQTTLDYLRVWLVPSNFSPTPGTQITAVTGTTGAPGRVQVGQFNQNGTTWQSYSNASLNLTNYAGTVMRLVFEWVNNATTGTQPPAAVDNIVLRICSTATPVVTVTPASITHNTAIITWPQDDGGASYKLRYRPVGSTGGWLPSNIGQDVTPNYPTQNITISGLNPATLYEVEVAAVCNTINVGAYSHNEFTTTCDPTPPNVTFTSITSSSAVVNWSPLVASATYEMRWRKVGDGWPTGTVALPNPPATTYLLQNLIPYTQYEVQIRSTCVNSTTPNPWSSLSRFTTERTCDIAPPGLTILELKPTSAKIQWDPYIGPDATGQYILRYRKVGIPGWTNVSVSTNIYTLTGLAELTKYEMEVANICSGTPGNFTLPYYFTTPTVIYCQQVAVNSAGDYISKVTVVPSGKPQMIKASAGSTYTDYTADPLAQIELIQGSGNNQLTIDKVATGDAGVVAWIDFNRNGEFDINERILVSGPNNAATATTTFNVPTDAFVSNVDYMYVVMRVALMKGGIPVNCTNFDSGEVEDYTVRITKKATSSLLNQTDILIYPNPVTTVLNVKNISKRATYKIYSSAGQLITSGIILNNKVDVHALINGMYVIDIQDGSTSVQKKFIKE